MFIASAPEVIPGLAVNPNKLKGIQLLTNIFGTV